MPGAYSSRRSKMNLGGSGRKRPPFLLSRSVMFAASLLLAGRLQDRFGPFWISLTGSILVTLSFLLFAYTSSLYFLYFFYGVLGGIGTRIWFRDGCSGHGQVVSGQNGLGDRPCARGIWRRIGYFWLVRKSGVVSPLWLAHFLHDPGRNFFCDDHDWGLSVEESGGQPASTDR